MNFRYFKWIHSYWKRRGIEGPVGLPFIGSFYDLADREKPRGFIINKWTKVGFCISFFVGCFPAAGIFCL